MNSQKGILVIVVVVIGLLVLYFFLPRSESWFISYDPNDDRPYGSYVLGEMLRRHGDQEFKYITDSLHLDLSPDQVKAGSNMVFVGTEMFIDSAEAELLLDFMLAGGNLYIISHVWPEPFYSDYLSEYQYDEIFAAFAPDDEFIFVESGEVIHGVIEDSIKHTLAGPVPYQYVAQGKFFKHNWRYIDGEVMSDEVIFRGFLNDDHLNAFSVKVGKGTLNCHINPELFTNYFLLDPRQQHYCSAFFMNLGQGTIYWNEFNRHPKPDYIQMPEDRDKGPATLHYILEQPALRAAWYLLLAAVLMYVILGARRKQRATPILPVKRNTSIEYAKTIAQLYIREKDHKKIALLQIELFKSHLREHYSLNITREQETEEDIIEILHIKSNLSVEFIRDLFAQFKEARIVFKMTDEQLNELYQRLEHFYNNSK
ncbi:MAG: hypothetical protein KDC12_06305 [Flavobacteriales bacterium]|nr:hypothetical protein [Flavobacteriales bacterium]